MGFIIFLVLCLNVVVTMCGGSDKWCEQYENFLQINRTKRNRGLS